MKLATPALVVYLMAADDTPELAEAAVRGGATAIEIGIPYSDPLADGPTIQRAGQRSLDAGMTPPQALAILAEVDRRVDVPLIPMTYGAIVESYGRERFCADAAAAGADGLIVVGRAAGGVGRAARRRGRGRHRPDPPRRADLARRAAARRRRRRAAASSTWSRRWAPRARASGSTTASRA